jgi:tetratricopeptide (TPR) repeat protein
LVWHWRKRRYLTVGWCWFLGTLVPMIGIITVGEQAMADRFAYIPCIGVFVAVAWALNDWVVAGAFSQRRIRSASLAASAVIVALICGALTYRQLGYWRDDETLWRYTLSVTKHNYMAHDNLALALAKQGRSEEALTEFHAAAALHKYPLAQVLELAWYEERVGHPEQAVEECNSILLNSTDQSDPELRAATWTELGQAHLELHQYEQATESYQNALRLSAYNEAALVGLGVLAMREQEFDDAVNELQHAVKLDPSAVNFLLLARAQWLADRPAEADAATAEAQKISPDVRQSQMEVGRLLNVAGVVAPE